MVLIFYPRRARRTRRFWLREEENQRVGRQPSVHRCPCALPRSHTPPLSRLRTSHPSCSSRTDSKKFGELKAEERLFETWMVTPKSSYWLLTLFMRKPYGEGVATGGRRCAAKPRFPCSPAQSVFGAPLTSRIAEPEFSRLATSGVGC